MKRQRLISVLMVGLVIGGIAWFTHPMSPDTGDAPPPIIPATLSPTQMAHLASVQADDLLIGTESFPPEWEIFCPDPCDDGHPTEATRTFLRPNHVGKAIHDVFVARTPQDAQDYVEKLQDTYGLGQADALTYQSRFADAEVMRCGIARIPICRVVTRYQSIVSVWYFALDDGSLAISQGLFPHEMDTILEATDTHLGTTLAIPPRKP